MIKNEIDHNTFLKINYLYSDYVFNLSLLLFLICKITCNYLLRGNNKNLNANIIIMFGIILFLSLSLNVEQASNEWIFCKKI